MIQPNYAELLGILETKRTGMESRQVHDIAHKNQKSLLGDVTAISQMLWQCKDTGRVVAEKRDGAVFNKITLKGLQELSEFNRGAKMQVQDVITKGISGVNEQTVDPDPILEKVSKIKALKAQAKQLAAELVDDLLKMED